MSLQTGIQIHGYQWDELHIDDYVIQIVEALVEKEDHSISNRGMPCFNGHQE